MPARKIPARRPAPLVRKADKPAMVAIYNATGKVIGICDPDKITPISDVSGGSEDLEPVPPAEVGTPADEVGKATVGELKKRMYTAATTAEQNRIADHLNAAAAKGLRIIHSRGAA